MSDEQLEMVADFLMDYPIDCPDTNCDLRQLQHIDVNKKKKFINELSEKERIGLLVCYKICIDKKNSQDNDIDS